MALFARINSDIGCRIRKACVAGRLGFFDGMVARGKNEYCKLNIEYCKKFNK